MSRAWSGGSTRSWRRIRAYVLDRDRHACQVPVARWSTGGRPSLICGAHATTAGHITAKVDGGTEDLANLRAECAAHNYADGGRLAHAARALARSWSW